ncbi:GFA family protein [Pandoraea sp. 64-18]|uniref:GFA family protein n=1 Tax=Pandoraea sp. 64-18 TaxID=1895806 RepID=UPI000963AF89|nr:GFA family protein [Pandoraea sp. 64-18]OJY17701.1 MAG: aldehyde-activating protein [Pandoraea sp. 64-18]
MTEPNSLRCLCGTVNIQLKGQPEARANCHCQSCRDFYGTSMLSATAWLPERVAVISGSLSKFAHPTKQLSRAFCPHCGETVFGTNRLGMLVIPNSFVARAAGGELPEPMQATMHLFYRHRIIDVDDKLPKYLDGWDGPTYVG